MYYSITLLLPKNKTQQFAETLPVNISELNIQQFEAIISQYINHIALDKNKNNLELYGQKYNWSPSEEQLNFLQKYYSQNPINFADPNTTPGNNNTIDIENGKWLLGYLSSKSNNPEQSYISLGLNPMPYIKFINVNVALPQENINPLYSYNVVDPDPETFKKILEIFLKEGYIESPLTYNSYKYKLYSMYPLNNQLYRLPGHNKIFLKKDNVYISPYYIPFEQLQNENIPTIPLKYFESNKRAWVSFLNEIDNINAINYDNYKETFPVTRLPKINNQIVKYYTYKNEYYLIPAFRNLSPKLKNTYEEIASQKETSNSLANQALKELKEEEDLIEILKQFGYEYKTERRAWTDPRFETFIKTEIQTRDAKNIFNYFWNAVKNRKRIFTDTNNKNIHKFNLSTHFFHKIPEDYKNAILDPENPLYEFEVYWEGRNVMCKTNLPNKVSKPMKLSIADFRPETYRFDAVLIKGNEIKYIIEFDGSDHFSSLRNYSEPANFMTKLTSDQIKSAFSDKYNIPIIRIPEYNKRQKNNYFKNEFKTFILNILKQTLGIQNKPETINTGIYQKSPE